MIEISYEGVFVMFALFAAALYYTWIKAEERGYGNACYDVAAGNITVSLKPFDEEN